MHGLLFLMQGGDGCARLLDGIAPDDVGEFGLTAAFRHRLEAPGRVVVRQTSVDQARGRNGPEDRLAVMIDGRPVAQCHPRDIHTAATPEARAWLESVGL